MTDVRDVIAAIHALESLKGSLPYTPPEMCEHRVLTALSHVCNILDPEGRMAGPLTRAISTVDNINSFDMLDAIVADHDLRVEALSYLDAAQIVAATLSRAVEAMAR